MRNNRFDLLIMESYSHTTPINQVLYNVPPSGIYVESVTKLSTAQKHLADMKYDLVALHAPCPESVMRGETWIEVTELLACSCGAPVAVITGEAFAGCRQHALKAGASGFIIREHLTPAGLVCALRKVVREHTNVRVVSATRKPFSAADDTGFYQIMEQLGDGILLTDSDHQVVYANPAAAQILGRTSCQLLGRPIRFPIDPGEQTEIELQFDGRTIAAEVTLTESTWENEPVLLAVLRDVTRAKAVEDEQKRLSTAIEQASDFILVADTDGQTTYVNPAFEETTGYSRNEVIGQSPGILSSGKQDEGFYQDLWSTISDGHVWRGRLVNSRKNGELFEVETSISPVKNASGQIVSYVQVGHDTTSQSSLEEQLRQAQKMEAVGRLAGGVAHDFNNLLTAIMGNIGLLELELCEDHAGYPYLCEIADAGTRAAELTGQLLMFSRKETATREVVNLNSIVMAMDKLLQRIIGEDVHLKTLTGHAPCMINADRGQVEQVILNLAVNARDAMPTGGKLTIEVRKVSLDYRYSREHAGVEPGEYIMLAVSDTGTGMDEKTRSRLFEPFFTTKGEKGTGLGLATAYGIITQHGGSILCYSEIDHGTTFKVYLPIAEQQTPRAQVFTVQSDLPGGRERILVVDDEATVRDVAARMLSASGYQILSAADGNEALNLHHNCNDGIDLLLVDVVLPDISGREVARILSEQQPGLRILFASGYTEDAIHRHGVLDDGIAFIQKPFGLKDLLTKVRQTLDRPVCEFKN